MLTQGQLCYSQVVERLEAVDGRVRLGEDRQRELGDGQLFFGVVDGQLGAVSVRCCERKRGRGGHHFDEQDADKGERAAWLVHRDARVSAAESGGDGAR